MKMNPMLGMLWLGLLLAACGEHAQPAASPGVRDSAGVRIVESTIPSWTTPWRVGEDPLLDLGAAEDDPDLQLFDVSGALLLPSGVVIANRGSHQLKLFDTSGALIRSVGREGDGPGEFRSLGWIARVGSDSLMTYDWRLRRFSVYDTAGQLIGTRQVGPDVQLRVPQIFGAFADGTVLFAEGAIPLGEEGPRRIERAPEPVFRYDPATDSVAEVGSFPGWEFVIAATVTGRFSRSPRHFGRNTGYVASGDRFYVGDTDTYEIQVRSATGQLRMLIRLERAPRPVTDADLRTYRDSLLKRYRTEEQRSRVSRSFEDRPAPPETMPAHAGNLLVDADGNLWVREFSLPGDRAFRWSVFHEDGVLLGTLDVPHGLTLLDIGTHRLLGRWLDDLGVEHVRVYELIKG